MRIFTTGALRASPLILLASGGCLSILNAGYEVDGGTHSSTTTAAIAASSGTASGGTTGGATSGGGHATTGGATSGGGHETTGGTGGCLADQSPCSSSAECCGESCNGICLQGAGQTCQGNVDCSSGVCDAGVCACSGSTYMLNYTGFQMAWFPGACATDADCCNGVSCAISVYDDIQTGVCCNQVGGACQDPGDCCNGNCVDGGCACLETRSRGCEVDGDCCSGVCTAEHLPPEYASFAWCAEGAGGTCDNDDPFACESESCVDGGCSDCSASGNGGAGFCRTSGDCCAGLICAALVEGSTFYPPPVLSQCYLPNGAACDPDGDGGYCAGTCDNEVCTCVPHLQLCVTQEGCCSGSTCMTAGFLSGVSYCCTVNGQECGDDGDCCTGYCQGFQCACVPQGGACGPPRQLSPAGPQACCSGSCSDGGTCR